MRLISKCQREVLTYWAPLDPENPSNEYGETVFAPAIEMRCRWDDKIQEIIQADGTTVHGKVQLITEQKLAVGGIVIRKPLDEVTYMADPRTNPEAYKVMVVMETPTINYRARLYEAIC